MNRQMWQNAATQRNIEQLRNYSIRLLGPDTASQACGEIGDGRKLEQTLTGNSIHYILDSEGRPVDAIAGLYSPQAFIENLNTAEGAVLRISNIDDPTLRRDALIKYHRDRLTMLEKNWRSDLTRLRLPAQPLLGDSIAASPDPSAMLASRLTIGKMAVELPTLLRTTSAPLSEATTPSAFAKLSDENWARLARRYQPRVILDQSSLTVMQRKLPSNASMANVIRSFEQAIAQDTVRNEYVFHAQIHNWFANGEFVNNDSGETNSLTALNRRVYDRLFLTPASDPWLGLVNENVYTGIGKL
jgi:hypothetical protein